jgi:hypothetical protein
MMMMMMMMKKNMVYVNKNLSIMYACNYVCILLSVVCIFTHIYGSVSVLCVLYN